MDLSIDNSTKALNSLFSKLKKIYKKEIKDIVFVYEPTSHYSDALYRFCANKKIKTFKINPKTISITLAKAIAPKKVKDALG